MIKTNSSFSKKDDDWLVFDESFFDKYQDKQIIAYSNPNGYRPTAIIILYSEGDEVVIRWPSGYEQFFKKNDKDALNFFKKHSQAIGGVFEKNEIILEDVQDAKHDVPREYKYNRSAFVQMAWCDHKGQIYIGNLQEIIDSFKSFLQDEEMDDSSREIVEKFLQAEDNANKPKNNL